MSHQVGDETSPCQQAWKKQPSILLESAVVHVEIVYAQGPDVWAGAILRLPPDASPRRPVGHVKWTKFDVAGRLATPATGESRKFALNEGRISGFLVFPSYFTCRKKGGGQCEAGREINKWKSRAQTSLCRRTTLQTEPFIPLFIVPWIPPGTFSTTPPDLGHNPFYNSPGVSIHRDTRLQRLSEPETSI